jgi:hypothetical protein
VTSSQAGIKLEYSRGVLQPRRDRLARVDAYAARLGVQRAEAVRQLVDRALSGEQA